MIGKNKNGNGINCQWVPSEAGDAPFQGMGIKIYSAIGRTFAETKKIRRMPDFENIYA